MVIRHVSVAFMVAIVAIIAAPTSAVAHTAAGLLVDFDDVEPIIEEELNDELVDIFARSSVYQWLPPQEGIAELDEALQGCFEPSCLTEIGAALDARLGVRIAFDVESHIYDWSIDFYDLASGQTLVSEVGTCELCGRSEVLEQFRASVAVHLGMLKLDEEAPSEPLDPTVDVAQGQTEVQITTVPEDTRIFVDDEPVGEGLATITLDEGTYEIRFSHDSHFGLRETLIIGEDSAPLFVMRVHLREAGGETRQVMTRDGGLVDRIEGKRKLYGWTAIATGAGLTATGIALATRHGQPNCAPGIPARQCPEVYDTAGVASASTILGAISLTTGAMLLLWPTIAGQQQDPVQAGIDITPEIGHSFSGLRLRGRF